MSDSNSFKEKLWSLIEKFEKDSTHYLSKGYPEAQVRIDFLNPFFEALGWDIENKAQKPPHERDVIVELSPETTGRPDYNFRINGATKFFVEAKSPSVALHDINHILQAKTYAWSTKEVYFVVLTDFEEFRLYDASLKPNPKFPDEGLILVLKYTDYLDNIEKLWELSKERIEQGSLEALLPKDTKSKRLRIPPDKSFLEDLTIWRTEIAKDIHKRNSEFDVKLLNDVVQKLLDRIIFIRIAEDRRIRSERELWDIVAQWKEEGKRKSIMAHLLDLFHEVNDDLNGDIFKPHACEKADVDSNLIAEIIENLYFPKSRYRFDAIGVELLGSIYERYLGSTIRVTPQRVKVEEKPEVRKAGGVYYTPKYIVDYIVKNTVGKLIEGKSPKQIEKIKILDPACGSGSFLLGAYQYLIDYHLQYYREHPKEAQTLHLFPYWKISPEELILPIHEKAKILRNNIFGVDIDPQAVEITMMSLYLKALEGERGMLPKKQHLLPPLSNNIKCGNSLIGYDILDQGNLFDDETKSRINPFDWNSKSVGFGEIIESGGFDVVIGNPPYIVLSKEGFDEQVIQYLGQSFKEVTYQLDSYLLFMVQAGRLSKNLIGYIVPNAYLGNLKIVDFRKWLLRNTSIEQVVLLLPDVFEGAVVDTTIIVFSTKFNPKNKIKVLQHENETTRYLYSLSQQDFISAPDAKINIHIEPRINKIIDKSLKRTRPLDTYLEINRGVHAYRTDGYGKSKFSKGFQTQRDYDERSYHSKAKKDETYKIEVRGKNIFRYYHTDMGEYISYGDWLAEQRNIQFFNQPRIYVRKIVGETLYAVFSDTENIPDQSVYIGILRNTTKLSLKFFLGILNSKLMVFLFRYMNNEFDTLFPQIKVTEFKQLPIRTIDFNNPSEKSVHDKLVSLVDSMLDLHKKKNSLPPSAEREKIEREITVTDEKIDEIVYGLYGVTEEERKIIEEK